MYVLVPYHPSSLPWYASFDGIDLVRIQEMRRRSHKRREMDVEYEEKKASLSLTQVGNPPPPPCFLNMHMGNFLGTWRLPNLWLFDGNIKSRITHEGDVNLRKLPTDPPRLHFEPPRSSRLRSEPRKPLNFDFNAEPDPAFHWYGSGCGSSFQKQLGSMRTRIRNPGSYTMRLHCLILSFWWV